MSTFHVHDAGGMLIHHRNEKPEVGPIVLPEPNLVLLTGAYCPTGCPLISEDSPRFDEFPGMSLLATWQGQSSRLTLSPYQGDRRRIGPDFPDGAMLELSCPICGTPLQALGTCTCGGEFVAIHTVQVPDLGYLVGICRRWGCFRSFLKDAGHVVTEYRMFDDTTDKRDDASRERGGTDPKTNVGSQNRGTDHQ